MKKVVSLIVVFLFVVFICVGYGSKKNESAKEPYTVPDIDKSIVYTISTDYAELKYPQKWQDIADVVVRGDTVKFSVDGVALFDIVFNGEEGFVLGTISDGEKKTIVRLVDHSVEVQGELPDVYNEMLSDVNSIVDNLSEDYTFDTGSDTATQQTEDGGVFAIKTSLATLYYPTKWKDVVSITTDDDSVRFARGKQKLFDLLFNSDEGNKLGSYNGTTISVVDYDIDENAYPAEEYLDLCEMQMDVNEILRHLMEDESFTLG